MKIIKINLDEIMNFESFHKVFKDKFGFPSFYGNNMDAWIDCMSSLDSPEDGMSKIHVEKGGLLVLELENVEKCKENSSEIFSTIVDCCAFVNYRLIEIGKPPIIVISYN